MLLELKRAGRRKFYLFFSAINVLNVILGYILLVTIDQIESITFQDMFASIYTVYTQFGTLLFSTFIMLPFYIDYKDKNVFFYKTLGFSALKYFLFKICMFLFATLIGTFISSIIICTLYSKLNLIPLVFFKIESVMIYFILIMSILGFIFRNFLVAFFVNIFLWIAGIVVAAGSSCLRYFAYYDASTSDYQYLILYLEDKVSSTEIIKHIAGNYLYDLIILFICIFVVWCMRRKWWENGI